MTKTCAGCGVSKLRTEFHRNTRKRDGLQSRCKDCRKQYVNLPSRRAAALRYRLAHPDRVSATERACRIQRLYGLTTEQYDDLVAGQGGKCAICGAEPARLTVDHDHQTGAVRALLCPNCNSALGKFGDDLGRLENAVAYLKAHR